MTARAATGVDGARVDDWVDRYAPELERHLVRMTGSRDDAEDLLQHVWIKAIERPPEQGPGTNVRAWLFRVATNAALDRIAGERRRRSLLARKDPEVAQADVQEPDRITFELGERARRRVREHCARLPRKQREAVWLRWVEGESYESIARKLGSTASSARANVYHGLKRLRRELADVWDQELAG